MYILKNAFKSIRRAKVRSTLIGIIALVIAVSACVALSIKQAAVKTKADTLEGLEITASISYDRSSQMEKLREQNTGSAEGGAPGGDFDRSQFKEMFSETDTALSLSELQKYAAADSVKDFYYTLTASLDETDSFEAVDMTGSTDTDSGESTAEGGNTAAPDIPSGGMAEGGRGGMGKMGTQGDFSVVGYSSDAAMSDFVSGVCSITDGAMFDEGTAEYSCVISDELATYNSVSVGDSIQLQNPNDETETVTLSVVGIYNNSQSTAAAAGQMSGFSAAGDSANKIYMSYTALEAITEASADAAGENDTAVRSTLAGTYTFADADAYESFCSQVKTLGLSDEYTVSSADLTEFEQSLQPLTNLSNIATYFLIVVFAIGAVILVVLNIFNIRERKYEIGVLTAIGMKKRKVALQFITELFVITLAAIVIGAGIGAATSVPVTNALLSSQIASNQSQAQSLNQSFGRDTQMQPGGGSLQAPDMAGGEGISGVITSVSYSTDLTVMLQLMGVGILLTLISSAAAVLFIMRYEPLRILSNRE